MTPELRSQYQALVVQAETIIRRAELEERGMSEAETAKVREHLDAAERLRLNDAAATSASVPAIVRSDTLLPGDAHARGRRFEPDRNGVVLLRSGDQVADFVAHHARSQETVDRASFGEFVRAIITGDQSRLSDFEARAMGASTLTGGGILAPSPIAANVLDYARAKSAIFQAGAVLTPMTAGTLTVAKVTSPITPDWVSENELADASDMAFGGVVLTTKSLVTVAKVGLELVEDAPNAAEVIEREFSAAMAAAFDTAALSGTGLQNQPKGLEFWTGINTRSLGTNGATPTNYDFLLDAQGDCWGAHADPEQLRHIMASRSATTLSKLKEATTNAYLRRPEALAPMLVSNQVSITQTKGSSSVASSVYTGDYRQMVIGLRIAFQFEISREAGDSSGSAFRASQVWMRGRLRGDVGILRANQFCVTSGVLE